MERSIRILHVEDEAGFADLVSTFLRREDEGIAIDSAPNADIAIDQLSENGYDCVISDYDMPGLNGIEFLETVRERYPTLPFILYTGKGSEEVASEAISAGVTDYLQKGGGTNQYAVLANRARNAVEKHRAEREAEQTRSRLEAIAANSNDIIVAIDAKSRILFTNNAVEELLGYAPSELEEEPLTSLMPPRHRENHTTAIERYLNTGERTINWQALEFEVLHRDGHEVPVSISFGEFEEDGDRRFVGIIRDITDRRQLEAEVDRSLRRYQTIVEQNLVGIYLLRDGRFEYVNPRFCEITGFDESDFASMDAMEIVAPESRDEVEQNVRKRLSGDIDEIEYQATIARKNGERREIRVHGSRIDLEGGAAILGTAIDVTEHVQLEEELKQERELFARVLATSPVGITILSPDGRIQRANRQAERVLGLTESEITDRTYDAPEWNIVDAKGEPIPEAELPFAQVLATSEAIFGFEHGIEWPDGSERWLSVNAAPLFAKHGEIERVVAVIQDITDQRDDGVA